MLELCLERHLPFRGASSFGVAGACCCRAAWKGLQGGLGLAPSRQRRVLGTRWAQPQSRPRGRLVREWMPPRWARALFNTLHRKLRKCMMACSGSAAILRWPWSAFVCVSNNLAFNKHEAGLPTTLQRLDAPCRAVQSDCFSGRSRQRQAGHCVQLCQPVGSSISARLSIFTVWCGWEASCCCSWPCRAVLRGPVTRCSSGRRSSR